MKSSKSQLKIYKSLSEVEQRRGLQKQNVYCVYTRIKGSRFNKRFVVLKDRETTTKNRAKSIYSKELGVSYLNVSMFMAYPELAEKRAGKYKLKKDAIYFKK